MNGNVFFVEEFGKDDVNILMVYGFVIVYLLVVVILFFFVVLLLMMFLGNGMFLFVFLMCV